MECGAPRSAGTFVAIRQNMTSSRRLCEDRRVLITFERHERTSDHPTIAPNFHGMRLLGTWLDRGGVSLYMGRQSLLEPLLRHAMPHGGNLPIYEMARCLVR